MDAAAEEGTHREHHRSRSELETHLGARTHHAIAFHQQIVDRLLEQGEVRLGFEGAADEAAVEIAVDLGAGRAHRRPLAGVQRAELDTAMIRRRRHDAAECVDLPDQMPFADTADSRIAAHLAEGLDTLGEQQGARAGASRGEGRLGTGVAATDDDDVV